MTPAARSMKQLRDAGYMVGLVEKWNQHAKIRQDLFNAFDLVAVDAACKGVLGVQVTSGSNVSARVKKLLELPITPIWLQAGNRIEVHGWRLAGKGRKTWQARKVCLVYTHRDDSWQIISREHTDDG